MATKLIELEDGTFIEIEAPGDQIEQISGGSADRVESSIDKIKDILLKTCRPLTETWQELSKDMTIDQAEIEQIDVLEEFTSSPFTSSFIRGQVRGKGLEKLSSHIVKTEFTSFLVMQYLSEDQQLND